MKTEPPKPGFQCLVSNTPADKDQDPMEQNLNSMMYIYEYRSDGCINKRPSNIWPHAILKYQLTNPNVHDSTIYTPCHNDITTSLSFSFNESDTSDSALKSHNESRRNNFFSFVFYFLLV